MDAVDALVGIQLTFSAVVLGYGARLDWRTRKVSNKYWMALSMGAMVFVAARLLLDDEPIEYLAIFVPIAAILSDIYIDSDGKGVFARYAPALKYGLAIATTAILGYLWYDSDYFVYLLTIPIMMLAFVLMYMFDIIRGGADAKALVALAVMFPFYPHIGSLPIIQAADPLGELVFPFAFIVLVNAAIVVVFVPIVFLFKNLMAGDMRFPQAVLGHRVAVGEARGRFVWLMERIVEGKHVTYTKPKRDEDLDAELDLLAKAGIEKVWVTPKIPFIIPIFVGLILTAVVGNILLLLMPL